MSPDQRESALELPARLDSLGLYAQWLADLALEWGLPAGAVQALELAGDEALTNIIHHAYPTGAPGPVRLRLHQDGAWLRLTLEDEGAPFDPGDAAPPDLDSPLAERRIGGLGLHFMAKLLDQVERRREGGVNRLVLVKRLEG